MINSVFNLLSCCPPKPNIIQLLGHSPLSMAQHGRVKCSCLSPSSWTKDIILSGWLLLLYFWHWMDQNFALVPKCSLTVRNSCFKKNVLVDISLSSSSLELMLAPSSSDYCRLYIVISSPFRRSCCPILSCLGLLDSRLKPTPPTDAEPRTNTTTNVTTVSVQPEQKCLKTSLP